MPTRLTLPLPPEGSVLVKQGEQVSRNTCLARALRIAPKENINVASLLGVPAEKLAKFLTCSIGAKISRGAVIARRSKFFTELVVRAPFEAKLSSVDLSKGRVVLTKTQPEKVEVRSPIAGRIVEIRDDEIELSFEGEIIEVNSGYGKATGELMSIVDKDRSFFRVDHQVAGKIVVMRPSDLLLAKLQALEAAGIITYSAEFEIKIPFVIIDSDKIEQLADFSGSEAIIDAEQGFVAIIE